MTEPQLKPDTKDRILEAAEEFFAERGFAGTSMRALTQAAGVNLAAAHYHFGSKEGLFEAVIQLRVEPISQEQRKQLDQLETRVGGDPPRAEEVVRAFLGPLLAAGSEPGVERLVGRLYAEPRSLVQPIVERLFTDLSDRFASALARALPHTPVEELRWRFHFIVGSMLHAIVWPEPLGLGSLEKSEGQDSATRLERLVAFATAGLQQTAAGTGDR